MRPHGLSFLISAFVCLACAERSAARSDTTSRAEPAAPEPRSTAPAAAPPAAPATSVADSSPVLALDGEGLRVFLRPSGSARLVAFGETRSAVIAVVSRLQQGVSPDVAENLECRATVATWPASGLQLWFSPDSAARFVGWSLGGHARDHSLARKLTTPSGIGLGSTRAALEDVYVARVTRSTLGVEFTAGGIAGLLASAGAEAPITNMWAGQVCLAR